MQSIEKNKIKKIIFFLPRQHTNLNGWFQFLKDNKIKIECYVLKKSRIENYSLNKPKVFPFINFKLFNFNLKVINFYSLIKKLNEQNKKNTIIVIREFNFFFNLILPLLIRVFCKIRFFIYTQVNLDYFYDLKLFKKIKIYFYSRLFKTSFISPVFNIDKVYFNKIFVPIPFLVKMKSKSKKRNKIINILSIGKFQKRKNFLLLLNSLLKIKKEYKLIIIGEKSNIEHSLELKKIKDFIKINNLRNVSIHTNVSNKLISNYYKWCDIYIQPAFNEPASISPLESLSFRKPVICSDTNGIKNYIKNGKNGYIFKDNDLRSLTKTIIKLTKNLKKIKTNLNKIEEKYLNSSLLKRLKLYDNVDF